MILETASSARGATGHQPPASANHCRLRPPAALLSFILALLLVPGGLPVRADQTIYSDSLAGSGNVAGSAPAIAGTDGATNYGSSMWTSTTANKSTRGSPATGRESNFLPFTPQPGRCYAVSATIDATGWASTEWYTVGFVQNNAGWPSMGNLIMGTLVRGTKTATTPHSATVTLTLDTRGPGWSNTKSYGYVGCLTDASGATGPKISNFSVVIQNPCAVSYVSTTHTSGDVPLDGSVYSSNATVTVLGNTGGLARTGYCFLGWNTAANGTGSNYNEGGTFVISSNTTLYAQWILVKPLAEIATAIRAVTTPMRGSTNLVLPSVPSGYALSIKSSSNPGVIGANGVINPPPANTVVQLVLTVKQLSNNQTSDTGVISLFVPASTGTVWGHYSDHFTMRRGLFISWGAPMDGHSNPIVFSDGTRSTSIDQFAMSANVPAVVDQIAGCGFEYIYLQDFHGYQTTLHPCAALDSWRGPGCTSTRDLVGEMIAGLKARGIKVYLFTHPLDGWDGYTPAQQAAVGFLDPTGNYQTWNNYINDVYAELTERYGDDLAGFGFDSDFGMTGNANTDQKLDMPRLRQTILSRRPQLCLGALAGPNATAETGIKEVYKPSWLDPWGSLSDTNYNVEVWPAYRRVPFVVQGYHWATVLPPAQGVARMTGTQLFRYSVLQAAVATEGPGICWSVSPYTDGTWENGVAAAFTELEAYVQPVALSLTNVLPSTSYPLGEGVSLATLPNGVAATRSLDDRIEYLHVLNFPGGNTLVLPLPSDGKQFLSATLLANGHAVTLVTNPSQVSLTLNAADNWTSPDTVIRLLVNPATIPQANLAFHKGVYASSSWEYGANWGAISPWASIRLVDGITAPVTATNGWSAGNHGFSTAVVANGFASGLSAANRCEWITMDLETTHSVHSVRLTPRNDNGNVGAGYPVDFAISTSLDGVNWTVATNLTSQPMATTPQTITFGARPARYVQLDVSQLRVNSGGTYGLQLSELEVFGTSGLTIQRIPNGVVLEWTGGVLQSTPSLDAGFTDVVGAGSPYTDHTALPRNFYRLRY